MVRRIAFVVALLAVAPAARAQAPEELLPAGTQLYIRWDGMKAHRDAYNKTALGKMLAGDTGKFIDGIFGQMQETVGGLLTVQSLLGGAAPEKLQKLTADATEATKLLPMLSDKGFILAVEARKLEPPEGQVTLILPDIGDNPKPFLGLMRLVAGIAQIDAKEAKIEGRTVNHFEAESVRVAWWIEGKHGVVAVGTDKAEAIVKRMAGKGENLTSNALYKKIAGFRDFETGARAFLDVASVVKLVKTRGDEVAKLIDDLGLDSLKSLLFYSGFDGVAERGLTEFEIVGPRKGLLELTRGKPFTLADVPPLPEDVISWSMTNFDLPALYDVGVKTAEHIVKLVAPDSVAQVKEALDEANKFLGINIRNDLLANLTGPIVSYSSPAEGPFVLGQTFMVKVKDAEKLHAALDTAIKAIGQAAGADVSVKKRSYRGVDLREVHVRQQGFIFVPTYAVHDGWLVLSYFPQAVQGYVLRAKGEVPAWKPGPEVRDALEKLPKQFVSVSVSDPRPTIKQLLSIAPVIGGLVNSFLPDAKIDVGTLPNAHEATKHLFPNVSVVSDDGKALRQETRASLALPFDVSGLDTYVIVFGGAAVLQYLRLAVGS
jgi:hypothetical protein